ncbi:MAG: restriction endonuclease subunit S [Opitutae bacterium]|nr:restriction endonuclease subunit S [Opitutae bacterium]
MAAESVAWDSVPLETLAEETSPITYGVVKPGDEGEVPFVRGGDIAGGRVLIEQLRTITAEVSQQYRRTLLRGGELLVSLVGNPGQVAIAPASLAGANIARQVGLVRLRRGVDSGFVSYFLQSPKGQEALGAQSLGSVQQVINLRDLKTVKVPLPPLPEQKAIARILGTLDDKIELNRRMNATLEAMARALFQSWFVDFDPVHAKAAGRQPSDMAEKTAALFPATFQDSELGKIPDGWRVGSIYEAADVIYGAPFSSKQFNEDGDGKPLIRIRDLADESPGVCTPEVHPKGHMVQPGDVVVGMDGEFRAYLWGGVPAWLNQRVCVFAPKPAYSAAFVRNSIIAPLAHVEATETATTVIHLGKNDIDRFKVIIPSPEIHAAFAKLCQPWYDRIVANKQQTRTLATLRDTLLPKLLSGEVEVAN